MPSDKTGNVSFLLQPQKQSLCKNKRPVKLTPAIRLRTTLIENLERVLRVTR